MPSSAHVMQVCRNGAGEAQCRYLASVPNAAGQFICAKLNPAAKGRVDDLVASGSKTIVGRADNCAGQK